MDYSTFFPASYYPNLVSVSGNVRAMISMPLLLPITAGTVDYKFYLSTYNLSGTMEPPDSAPTVAVANDAGVDRSANLRNAGGASTTMVNISTGEYWLYYRVAAAHAKETLIFTVTIVKDSITRTIKCVTRADSSYDVVTIDNKIGTPVSTVSADIAAVQADLGNPSARTNLKTIESLLGNPDTAGKTIYETQAVPTQDSATDSQIRDVVGKKSDTTAGTSLVSLIKVVDAVADAIQVDVGNPSARTNQQSIEAMLGNPDSANSSIYNMLAGSVDAVNRVAGKEQVKLTTIDLHNAAASYDIVTATTMDVIVESLTISPRINVSDDATITGISIQTNNTTPQILISQANGVKANLTAENQITWSGNLLLRASKKIQFTIYGGSADADPTTCDVVIKYRAATSTGYLA